MAMRVLSVTYGDCNISTWPSGFTASKLESKPKIESLRMRMYSNVQLLPFDDGFVIRRSNIIEHKMQLIVHASNGVEFSVGRMQLLVFQVRVLTLRFHQSAIDDTLNDKKDMKIRLMPRFGVFTFKSSRSVTDNG